MCAINPKHTHHFKLSVYTSLPMTELEFREAIFNKVVEAEQALNADMRLRWHIESEGE